MAHEENSCPLPFFLISFLSPKLPLEKKELGTFHFKFWEQLTIVPPQFAKATSYSIVLGCVGVFHRVPIGFVSNLKKKRKKEQRPFGFPP